MPSPPFSILLFVTLLLHLNASLGSSPKAKVSPSVESPLPLPSNAQRQQLSYGSKNSLPIETAFQFPSPLPQWPPGGGFAGGTIDLGGLQVRKITTFKKVWTAQDGGPNNMGATFFDPSPIPAGFSMLGSYGQSNSYALFGWVLVAKATAGEALRPPTDYTLVWSQTQQGNDTNGGFFWLPLAPDGYKAVGLVVTASAHKPPPEKVRCVRIDFTDVSQAEEFIWDSNKAATRGGFNVSGLVPSKRGVREAGVSAGTFGAQVSGTSSQPLACLRNKNFNIIIKTAASSPMPNRAQIGALYKEYAPFMYLHPDEQFFPSSVEWFFASGALLYARGNESSPVRIEPNGANLPQGGTNDGAFWLDLPRDAAARKAASAGNLDGAEAYLHVKPMLGGTFTDIAVWIFYPFNGPATAKLWLLSSIPLGKIGEHVGDWEHVTLRISNFDGELRSVYFSEHSAGRWVRASEVELLKGSNRVCGYASRYGHATYSKAGLVLQGSGGIGIRNDAGKGRFMDAGKKFSVVAAEYLGEGEAQAEPPWLLFEREWGPKKSYEDIGKEIEEVEKRLPTAKMKRWFEKFVRQLPKELTGEEGPTGPIAKPNWNGDEI